MTPIGIGAERSAGRIDGDFAVHVEGAFVAELGGFAGLAEAKRLELWKLHAAERVVELGDLYLLARIRDLGLPVAFAAGQNEFGEIADLGVSVRAHAVAHEHRIGDAADAVHESRLRTFSRATSSQASTTAQAPDERGQMSNSLYGVETGREFITSSTVIWPLR